MSDEEARRRIGEWAGGHLLLSGLGLSSLPESIGDLTGLENLNLGGNHLTSLPESIGNLTNLTSLYLGGNYLTSLPESIGDLTNPRRFCRTVEGGQSCKDRTRTYGKHRRCVGSNRH